MLPSNPSFVSGGEQLMSEELIPLDFQHPPIKIFRTFPSFLDTTHTNESPAKIRKTKHYSIPPCEKTGSGEQSLDNQSIPQDIGQRILPSFTLNRTDSFPIKVEEIKQEPTSSDESEDVNIGAVSGGCSVVKHEKLVGDFFSEESVSCSEEKNESYEGMPKVKEEATPSSPTNSTSEGSFVYPECDYRTPTACPAITYVRKHSGEKLYECTECDYWSTHASNLRTHMRTTKHVTKIMTDNKKRPTIRSKGRKLIANVIRFFDEEKSKGKLKYPINNATKRAASATGKSERSICSIRNGPPLEISSCKKLSTPPKKSQPSKTKIAFDDFDLCDIRRAIHNFYAIKKTVPTVKLLLVELKKEINYQGEREILRKAIHTLGFRFKKCKNKRIVLIERHKTVAWRAKYLRLTRMNDQNTVDKRPVVYLDETLIQPMNSDSKCWWDPQSDGVLKNDTAWQRWIIVHAGWEKGFIPGAFMMLKSNTVSGDYNKDMNLDNFSRWVREKLIPNLPARSLIVMDNAPYHRIKDNKPPTISSRKEEIIEWLGKNNISFQNDMLKSELLEIVRIRKPAPIFKIDQLFSEHGHKVLRLPPYHSNLNPIEYVWSTVKGRVARRNVDQSPNRIKELTEKTISEVTEDDWQKAIQLVKKEEAQYWETDRLVETEIERIIVSVGDEDSDSDNDSDDLTSDSSEMSGVE